MPVKGGGRSAYANKNQNGGVSRLVVYLFTLMELKLFKCIGKNIKVFKCLTKSICELEMTLSYVKNFAPDSGMFGHGLNPKPRCIPYISALYRTG